MYGGFALLDHSLLITILFCLRYDSLIFFWRHNHITFIFIKMMSRDLLVQMAYWDLGMTFGHWISKHYIITPVNSEFKCKVTIFRIYNDNKWYYQWTSVYWFMRWAVTRNNTTNSATIVLGAKRSFTSVYSF